MTHPRDRTSVATERTPFPLDAEDAAAVAGILQGLAAPSRILLLDRLRGGPISVGDLAEAVGMEQSAVSHQLRHLRELGFVMPERQGRHVVYRLFDDHIGDLIDQALSHAEHLRLAAHELDTVAASPRPQR